jgi:hypothetical protein
MQIGRMPIGALALHDNPIQSAVTDITAMLL